KHFCHASAACRRKWLPDEKGSQGRDGSRHLRYSTRRDLRQSRARHARFQRSTRNTARIPPPGKSGTRRKFVRPRDARLPPPRLGAWDKKDRAPPEPERENDR